MSLKRRLSERFRNLLHSHLLLFDTFLLASRSRSGFASMLAVFRIGASVAVLVRSFSAGQPQAVIHSPVWWSYLGLSLVLLAPLAWRLHVQESIAYQSAVLAMDTLAIHYFIYVTGDVGTELFLLLLIPLVTAATFLPRRPAVLTSLAVVGVYLGVLSLMPYDSYLLNVLVAWGVRSLFLLAAIWLYRVQRRLPRREEGEIISPSRARVELEVLLRELRSSVPFETVSVQLLYQDQLQIVATLGFPNPEEICQLEFPVKDERYPNGQVIRTGQPVIVNASDFPSFQHPQYHAGHIRSWMGVPLISPANGEPFGMLSIDSSHPDAYTRRDANRAGWFASKASAFLIEAALGP
ncbi:GAF domain-containing protein, partial [bacterium]|nr:GAF domain-containing protein [bacterium]